MSTPEPDQERTHFKVYEWKEFEANLDAIRLGTRQLKPALLRRNPKLTEVQREAAWKQLNETIHNLEEFRASILGLTD